MSDLSTAYTDHLLARRGPPVSRIERAHLCDLLATVGPGAPTLSGAWDTHHLAAHLVVREGTFTSATTLLPKVADDAVDALVAASEYGDLVDKVRQGPPLLSYFSLPQVDRNLNTLEFFVHHEDVRRAAGDWSARRLPLWAEDQIWGRLRWLAKLVMRHSPVGVVLARSDADDATTAVKQPAPAIVHGLPSEVALFVYGRDKVADVILDGPTATVEALRRKQFRV